MIKRYIRPFYNFIKTSKLSKSNPNIIHLKQNNELFKKSIYLRSTIYTFCQKNYDNN